MADAVGVVEDEDTFLETVRKRYKLCVEADRENRDRAREALKFRDLEQWDENVKKDRETDKEGARPCLVVDKLNQHVAQVVNDERLNRPQIKVRPVDDGGDVEVAKIYDGIVRHIQDRSHADIAYDTGFECAVDGGFGFWRLITEYCDPKSFDQDIRIMRVRNRFSVYLDPERQEPDGSDARYGFILYKVQKEDFKREFGKKGEEAVESFTYEGKEFTDWYGTDWVVYAEYFWKDVKKERICLLSDGQVVPVGQYDDAYLAAAGLTKVKERDTEVCTIKWRKLTATKILEDGEVVFDSIPIVEVVGNELDIEGKVKRSGMIRPAMDAQRVDNYSTSAFVENVALAPRAAWTAAAGQIEGYEDLWRTSNRRNISVLPYKPITVEGIVVPPPQRVQPAGISQGWLSVLQQSEHNIQAAMGRYNATLGAPSNETSGKAINARAREGDIGSFHFSDNEARSLRHTGQMIVNAIPKIYDVRRVARIIGEDGTPGQAIIDPNLVDEATGQPIPYAERPGPDGKIEKIYNLGVGRYDVTVVVGPSFTTRRLESADAMMEISRGNPEFLNRFGDIIFKSQDWPGAERIADRFKKMLPPELQEQEEEDDTNRIEKQKAQIQQAAKMLGEKEAQLRAAEQAAAELAEQSQQMEQAAKDAIAKAQAKVDEINEASTKLDAERQVLAAERREAALAKQLAEAQIKNVALQEAAKLSTAAASAERDLVSQREQELTVGGQLPPELLRGLAESQMNLAETIAVATRAMTAPRELILDPETGDPVGSRVVEQPAVMQ